MSTVVTAPRFAKVPVTVTLLPNTNDPPFKVKLSPEASPSTTLPVEFIVVNEPAAGVVPPTVPSNVPELMSALDITTEQVPVSYTHLTLPTTPYV